MANGIRKSFSFFAICIHSAKTSRVVVEACVYFTRQPRCEHWAIIAKCLLYLYLTLLCISK